ncbi:MAG: hypothetical protein ACLSCR_07795 [Akkermansia sp.]
MAQAADKYSIIPEPERTELKPQTAKRSASFRQGRSFLGKDAYRLPSPRRRASGSRGREGRLYDSHLRQLQDQLAAHPEASPAASSRTSPATPGAA